ncbi:MAG: hypothetical protein Q8O98_00130 [bacterium]|nr:hypothetical protein [bacterium]
MASSLGTSKSATSVDAGKWFDNAKPYGKSSLIVTIPGTVKLKPGESSFKIISRSYSREFAVQRLMSAVA